MNVVYVMFLLYERMREGRNVSRGTIVQGTGEAISYYRLRNKRAGGLIYTKDWMNKKMGRSGQLNEES